MGRIRGFPRTGVVRELSTFRLDENSKRIRLHSREEGMEFKGGISLIPSRERGYKKGRARELGRDPQDSYGNKNRRGRLRS